MDTLNGYTTYRYDKYQELYLDYANHVIEVGRKLNNN